MTPLEYLRRDEWTMGNGQCGECFGQSPHGGWDRGIWATHPKGHTDDCALAASIANLGGPVQWSRDWVVPEDVDTSPCGADWKAVRVDFSWTKRLFNHLTGQA